MTIRHSKVSGRDMGSFEFRGLSTLPSKDECPGNPRFGVGFSRMHFKAEAKEACTRLHEVFRKVT